MKVGDLVSIQRSITLIKCSGSGFYPATGYTTEKDAIPVSNIELLSRIEI